MFTTKSYLRWNSVFKVANLANRSVRQQSLSFRYLDTRVPIFEFRSVDLK